MDLPSPLPSYRVTKLSDDFRGKAPPLFIHKGMTLNFKITFLEVATQLKCHFSQLSDLLKLGDG